MCIQRTRRLILSLLVCFMPCMELWSQSVLDDQAAGYFTQAELFFLKKNPTAGTDLKAEALYQSVIELYEASDSLTPMLADSYQRLASIAFGRGDILQAKDGYHKALSIKKAIKGVQDSLYFQELILLGDIHYVTDRPDSAAWYYKRAENIALRYDTLVDKERIYNSYGAFHYSIGNYLQAINYYRKALSLMDEGHPDYLEAKVSFSYNIANAQLKMSQFKSAVRTYQELLGYGIYSEHIHLNLGIAYAKQEKYDSALLYLDQTVMSNESKIRLASFNAMGYTALERKQFNQAVSNFEQAITENLSSYSQKNLLLAKSYLGLAKALKEAGRYDEAKQKFNEAISSNSLVSDKDTTRNRPDNSYHAISLQLLFNAYQGLAQTSQMEFDQTQETKHLVEASQHFSKAIEVARHMQKTYHNDEAKLFLVQEVYPIYEKALANAYQLYQGSNNERYIELAFQISERSKASVLTEMLDELQLRSSAQLSDSLIQQEKNWKQKVTATRLKINENPDEPALARLRSQLVDNELALSRTIRALKDHQKYYRLKYQEDSLSVSELQSTILDDRSALLEYFMGERNLYAFLISPHQLMLTSIPIDSNFTKALDKVKSSLYDFRSGDTFQHQAELVTLYQTLIAPYEKELASKERLIIVPDGSLHYIPMDMLTKPEKDQHYLLYDYTFSYTYSASLLKDAVSKRKTKEEDTILAMAPFTGNEEGNIRSNGFNMLFSSKEEVEGIGGSIYLENQATKRLFLELASSYGIVHLATHASISSEDPLESFIAFYPGQDTSSTGYRLYTHELYNMQLDSVKLVVLSACEAGNGKLVQGEGVISLARAFAYAGCPNVVTTLWKAQDKSTAAIATGLHEYLRKGYAKDEALRKAKLDYLAADDIHPVLKTPYYWANFVFIGDPAPIYEYSSFNWLLFITGAIFLIILLIIRKQGVFKSKKP